MEASGRILLLLLVLGCMAVLPSLSHGETTQLQELELERASHYMRGGFRRPWCRRGEARWWFFRNPWCVLDDPSVKQCIVGTLRPVPGCMQSVFQTYASGKVSLSPACCDAVHRMSEDCFPTVFVNPFNSLVKEFCALASDGAPSPALE